MSEPLTLAWLQASCACEDAVKEFRRMYPGGAAPLADVVAKLAEHPEGAGWFEWLLVRHPALQPYRAAYDAARSDAWDAYWAARQTAWAAYKAAVRPAWDAYEAAERPAWDAYKAAVRPAWDAYEAAERPAWDAYEAAERAARAAYEAAERAARAAYDAARSDAMRDVARKMEGGGQ